jgi:excinuclease ABC subunit C
LKIQNEVHRFAITFFRTRKQSSLFKSKLEEIPEIGNATINKLLNNYQNMSSIKDAAIEEIAQYVGLKKAKIIKKHLQND